MTPKLRVHVQGMTLDAHLPTSIPSQSQLDAAVWATLRRFNLDPSRFKGWIRKPAAEPAVVRVVVS